MGKIARIKNNKLYLKGVATEVSKKTPELYFNGVNPAITILNTNNRLQPSDTFTWEMWFKLDGYTQYNTLMGFSANNLDLGRMDSVNNFRCHIYDNENIQQFLNPRNIPDVNDGVWHHIAISWDNVNGVKFCLIDGILRDEGIVPIGTRIRDMSTQSIFTIGGSNPTNRLIKGWIKDVRMWNVARTQEEILADMSSKLIGDEEGLFLYLPLDEGKGETVIDKASGFEANINGAIWEGNTKSLELDGILRGWSGGYTTNLEAPDIYYVKGLRGGFIFPQKMFEVGETYTLSFKTRKTSGDILTIGGHSQSFEDVEVYLDNELIGNNWGSGLQDTYPNDDLEHNYKVILTFNGSAGDSNLYIQINRNNGYATEYTAEIYDLKLEKMKVPNLSLDSTGGLTTLNEIIEYPIELEGGRNLVVLSDIVNSTKVEVTDTGWIVRDSYSTILNYDFHVKLEPNTEYSVSYEMEIIEQGDATNTYPGRLAVARSNPWLLTTFGNKNTTKVVDSFITDDLGGLRLTCYGSLGGVVEFKNVKIEKGNKVTSWTPSPEDLGLEYSSGIQYFNMGIKDKILMINELIEGGV